MLNDYDYACPAPTSVDGCHCERRSVSSSWELGPSPTMYHTLKHVLSATIVKQANQAFTIVVDLEDKARGAHRGTLHRNDGCATVEVAWRGFGGAGEWGEGGVGKLARLSGQFWKSAWLLPPSKYQASNSGSLLTAKDRK